MFTLTDEMVDSVTVCTVILRVFNTLLSSIYRKSRFEKELMNMIWKVNKNEIKMRRPRVPTQNSIPDRDNNANPRKKLVRAVRPVYSY